MFSRDKAMDYSSTLEMRNWNDDEHGDAHFAMHNDRYLACIYVLQSFRLTYIWTLHLVGTKRLTTSAVDFVRHTSSSWWPFFPSRSSVLINTHTHWYIISSLALSYFLNILYFVKCSCTNNFHRRSLCTFYQARTSIMLCCYRLTNYSYIRYNGAADQNITAGKIAPLLS